MNVNPDPMTLAKALTMHELVTLSDICTDRIRAYEMEAMATTDTCRWADLRAAQYVWMQARDRYEAAQKIITHGRVEA